MEVSLCQAVRIPQRPSLIRRGQGLLPERPPHHHTGKQYGQPAVQEHRPDSLRLRHGQRTYGCHDGAPARGEVHSQHCRGVRLQRRSLCHRKVACGPPGAQACSFQPFPGVRAQRPHGQRPPDCGPAEARGRSEQSRNGPHYRRSSDSGRHCNLPVRTLARPAPPQRRTYAG